MMPKFSLSDCRQYITATNGVETWDVNEIPETQMFEFIGDCLVMGLINRDTAARLRAELVTDDQIRALKSEASREGDVKLVVVCLRALGYYHPMCSLDEQEARIACARTIAAKTTGGDDHE